VRDLDPALLACPDYDDRMGLVLDRLARREAAPHAERLAAVPHSERARAAAAILHEIGGFAEAVEVPGGVEIRDYNCVYRGLRPAERGPCAWHGRLLPLLLQIPVGEVPAADGAGQCCRILMPSEAPQPAPAVISEGISA